MKHRPLRVLQLPEVMVRPSVRVYCINIVMLNTPLSEVTPLNCKKFINIRELFYGGIATAIATSAMLEYNL